MNRRLFIVFPFLLVASTALCQQQWPQGSGPNASFVVSEATAPTTWSVTRNENIAWKKTLPETGQSTVTIWGNRIFFTTLKEVEQDSAVGKDIVAWCCDAQSGKTIWTRKIQGDYPLRLSGCFSDSSAPPPVTDGQRVCFFNASGRIVCYDFEGKELWQYEAMPVGRTQPFLLNDNIVFIKQNYMPDENGHFSHEHKNAPLNKWTQIQAVDIKSGQVAWTSQCGVGMGAIPLPHMISGKPIILVGRGGGHSPPEKPDGVSAVDGTNGETLWTLPLTNFMSTMTLNVLNGQALIFHADEHLWVNITSGEIEKRVSFLDDVPVRVRQGNTHATLRRSIPGGKKPRAIIQQSNVLVGDYHYFRSYTQACLGRVHVPSGKVEYLQLPLQLIPAATASDDRIIWSREDLTAGEPASQWGKNISYWTLHPNDMKNSRGLEVMGDKRSRGGGWGHYASAVPTAIGQHLYVPIMGGSVFVIRWNADALDEHAIAAINDLGPAGTAWNRASISSANGRLYAHTMRELICIEAK